VTIDVGVGALRNDPPLDGCYIDGRTNTVSIHLPEDFDEDIDVRMFRVHSSLGRVTYRGSCPEAVSSFQSYPRTSIWEDAAVSVLPSLSRVFVVEHF
jgi:hypothetical protein